MPFNQLINSFIDWLEVHVQTIYLEQKENKYIEMKTTPINLSLKEINEQKPVAINFI